MAQLGGHRRVDSLCQALSWSLDEVHLAMWLGNLTVVPMGRGVVGHRWRDQCEVADIRRLLTKPNPTWLQPNRGATCGGCCPMETWSLRGPETELDVWLVTRDGSVLETESLSCSETGDNEAGPTYMGVLSVDGDEEGLYATLKSAPTCVNKCDGWAATRVVGPFGHLGVPQVVLCARMVKSKPTKALPSEGLFTAMRRWQKLSGSAARDRRQSNMSSTCWMLENVLSRVVLGTAVQPRHVGDALDGLGFTWGGVAVVGHGVPEGGFQMHHATCLVRVERANASPTMVRSVIPFPLPLPAPRLLQDALQAPVCLWASPISIALNPQHAASVVFTTPPAAPIPCTPRRTSSRWFPRCAKQGDVLNSGPCFKRVGRSRSIFAVGSTRCNPGLVQTAGWPSFGLTSGEISPACSA